MSKKEIVEIDLSELSKLKDVIVACEGLHGRFDGTTGFLVSPGCEGDYGCCASQFDLEEFVDDLCKQAGIEGIAISPATENKI
jgi:hypothetical protein